MENRTVLHLEDVDMSFESISDFKFSMECGGEIVFIWKGQTYCACGKDQKTPESEIQKFICKADEFEKGLWADTVDEILEFDVGGDRLRDIVTQVEVIERTI